MCSDPRVHRCYWDKSVHHKTPTFTDFTHIPHIIRGPTLSLLTQTPIRHTLLTFPIFPTSYTTPKSKFPCPTRTPTSPPHISTITQRNFACERLLDSANPPL